MRTFLATRATLVGALALVVVAVGCGGSHRSAGKPGGGRDGSADSADGSGPPNDGGGGDAAVTDAGGKDAQDASLPPEGSTDGGIDAGDAAPDAPAWTGHGVLAAGVAATSFTTIGSTIYFGGTDAAHGDELWTTDITPQGTKLVYDACPGTCDGYDSDILQVNGHTIFAARPSSGADPEMFLLPPSGTPTVLGGTIGSFDPASHQGFAGSKLVYCTQFDLWVTDGTVAGTKSLSGLNGDYCEEIMSVGSRVLLSAGQSGTSPVIYDLWGTDGTSAGLAKLETGNATSRTLECTSNGEGYVVTDNALLTISDGTAGGTQTAVGGVFTQLAMFGVLPSGTVIFEASTGNVSTSGLYESDGTTVAQIGTEGPDYWPMLLGSKAIFPSSSDVVVTDGTSAGTSTLKSFAPDFVRTIGAAGSYVYFYVVPFTAQAGVQPQLWKTDGTAAGTTLVMDLPLCPSSGCSDSSFSIDKGIASGSTLAFVVYLGNSPSQTLHLWSTGGTAATTHEISGSLSERAFLPVGSGALFSTTADDLRYEPL